MPLIHGILTDLSLSQPSSEEVVPSGHLTPFAVEKFLTCALSLFLCEVRAALLYSRSRTHNISRYLLKELNKNRPSSHHHVVSRLILSLRDPRTSPEQGQKSPGSAQEAAGCISGRNVKAGKQDSQRGGEQFGKML
jgi:hypothetical protein